MIKSASNLLIALLITVSSFSQDTYPRLVLPGSSVVFRDTVVVISLAQMDSVNSTFIWNEQLHTTIDTLMKNLQTVYRLSHIADSTNQQQLLIASARIAERDNLTSAQAASIKQKDKTIRKLRTGNTILMFSTGVLGVATLILLILL